MSRKYKFHKTLECRRIEQKADYVLNNPVAAGFVNEPHEWRYSSAIDYSEGKG